MKPTAPSRESRETGQPALLLACLKNVENQQEKKRLAGSKKRKRKGVLLCEKNKNLVSLKAFRAF